MRIWHSRDIRKVMKIDSGTADNGDYCIRYRDANGKFCKKDTGNGFLADYGRLTVRAIYVTDIKREKFTIFGNGGCLIALSLFLDSRKMVSHLFVKGKNKKAAFGNAMDLLRLNGKFIERVLINWKYK